MQDKKGKNEYRNNESHFSCIKTLQVKLMCDVMIQLLFSFVVLAMVFKLIWKTRLTDKMQVLSLTYNFLFILYTSKHEKLYTIMCLKMLPSCTVHAFGILFQFLFFIMYPI